MKEDYARRLGLSIERQQRIEVTVGNSKKVASTGVAKATFRVETESTSYQLTFHLHPECIHDVILGKPFLRATKTFSAVTNFARRVKQRILSHITERSFLYLGDSAPRFSGLVNGVPQHALADSGARVMVMDETYARSIRLSINNDGEQRTKLRFADGSTSYTSGMTYGVIWQFGPGGHGQKHTLNFQILQNAPANVVLSDSFLFGTVAFSQYDCFLVDEEDEDPEAYFFAIDVDVSSPASPGRFFKVLWSDPAEQASQTLANQQHPMPNQSPSADGQYFELVRRGEEEDRVANLPAEQHAEAWAIEQERRRRWDQIQAALESISNTGQDSVEPSASWPAPNTHSSSSPPPIAPGPSNQHQSRRKRFRYLFKLMRKEPT